MKLLHIGLAAYFTEGMTYQDNLLTEQNVRDGQEVLYISNAAKYVAGKIVETGYEDTILASGVHLVRLPYVHVLNHFVSGKFRKVKNLYQLIAGFRPDVIMIHSLAFWSVRDVIRYKKDHPEVKLYADTHADHYTSGTNWLSLHVLHRIFYRHLVQKALPYLEKYLCISDECRRFSVENYGVPESLTEFYPLGGTIPSPEEYDAARQRRRTELGVAPDELLLVHAGKLEPAKKTDTLLRAFAAVPELKAKLAVIGSIPEETQSQLRGQMDADPRVVYLGWKNSDELMEYLCAADLYCQPGKVSAIMQNAVCAGCPILLYPHPGYVKDYDYGNMLWVRNEAEITTALQKIAAGKVDLPVLRHNSQRCARELLDYRALAARLYR